MTEENQYKSSGIMKVHIKLMTCNLSPAENMKVQLLYEEMVSNAEYKKLLNEFNIKVNEMLKAENAKGEENVPFTEEKKEVGLLYDTEGLD
jgi:hypothetical protein